MRLVRRTRGAATRESGWVLLQRSEGGGQGGGRLRLHYQRRRADLRRRCLGPGAFSRCHFRSLLQTHCFASKGSGCGAHARQLVRHVRHAAALRNLIAATSETKRLVSDMQASGQKVADAMAAAFQQHGSLEINRRAGGQPGGVRLGRLTLMPQKMEPKADMRVTPSWTTDARLGTVR